MCIDALKAGKHVLCEKPLGRSSAECRKIVDAADEADRFLATGFNFRFYPSFEKAYSWLKDGSIGRLNHIRSYAGYSAKDHNQAWIHDRSVTGGGALHDNGIHLIDLTRYFLGEVVDVTGFASNSVWKFDGCEDNGFLVMKSPSGAVATLHASWTEWKGYKFLIEIYGDQGCIRASCFPMFAELIANGSSSSKAKRKREMFPYINLMEHLRTYRWIVLDSLKKELRSFAAAIRKETSAIATGTDGLRAVEIAAAGSSKLA
jgi:predicted dehydrogenase